MIFLKNDGIYTLFHTEVGEPGALPHAPRDTRGKNVRFGVY